MSQNVSPKSSTSKQTSVLSLLFLVFEPPAERHSSSKHELYIYI